MSPAPMTPRQFDWTLRVRGPALSAWPATEREAALALLQRHGGARDGLAAALAADEDGAEDAAGCVLDRIRGRVQAQMALRATAAPALRWGVRGGALAACLVAGLWAGGALDGEHDPLATVQVAALEALQ